MSDRRADLKAGFDELAKRNAGKQAYSDVLDWFDRYDRYLK